MGEEFDFHFELKDAVFAGFVFVCSHTSGKKFASHRPTSWDLEVHEISRPKTIRVASGFLVCKKLDLTRQFIFDGAMRILLRMPSSEYPLRSFPQMKDANRNISPHCVKMPIPTLKRVHWHLTEAQMKLIPTSGTCRIPRILRYDKFQLHDLPNVRMEFICACSTTDGISPICWIDTIAHIHRSRIDQEIWCKTRMQEQ